jgi:hypothetical protein
MKRIVIFFIFFGLFALSYQIGSMSEVNTEEAQKFLEEFETLIDDIDAVGIFSHNTLIALPMFIPGFGVGWGLFSAWSTGYAFASIVSLTPLLSEVPPLTLLFLSPFGLMELIAYSLGISRSYMLIWMVIKKHPFNKRVLKITGIEIGIMLGLLLAGGFIEYYMIEIAQESGFEMPGF